MNLVYPLANVIITQKFGERPEYYGQFGLLGHPGLDMRSREPEPVLASHPGICKVQYTGFPSGNNVRIISDSGFETFYGHLSQIKVQGNQRVETGQTVGLSGGTGTKPHQPHLHFGYRPAFYNINNGYLGYVDPYPLLVPPGAGKDIMYELRKFVGDNRIFEVIRSANGYGTKRELTAAELKTYFDELTLNGVQLPEVTLIDRPEIGRYRDITERK